MVSRPHLVEGLNSELKDDYTSLPDVDYEVDRATSEAVPGSENKVEKSAVLSSYVDEKRDAEIVRKESTKELKESRQTLMQTVPMELVVDTVDPRPKGKMLTDELIGTQIMVEPTELSFDLGVHEPFFGTMAMYDLKRKEKVSESWNFDLNPPNITELLGVHCGDREPATMARTGIFSTSYANPDIYMVIMFSTTLHGEESEALAPYLQTKMKDKEKEKFVQEVRLSTQRLGGYRQPFGYVVIPMFDESQALKPSKDTVVTQLMKPKSERDIYNLIEKYLDRGKGKTMIPCKFAVTIKKLGDKEKDTIRGRLTPSLQPVKPIAKGNDSKVIREMGDFTASSPEGSLRHMPNLTYENTLYLMPDTVNFSHVSGTSSRNIAIEVKLFADDSDFNGPGMPLIYGNSVHSALTNYARSHIFYHSKKPVFFDEIKIQLPTFLTSKHHLLITFSHLTCVLQKGKPNSNIETLVGRAVIPIYPGNRLVPDGRYSIPVAVNLPNTSYLSETPDSTNQANPVKWVDNGKNVFSFRVKTISTIYPQDPALDEFFKQYEVYASGKPASSDAVDKHAILAQSGTSSSAGSSSATGTSSSGTGSSSGTSSSASTMSTASSVSSANIAPQNQIVGDPLTNAIRGLSKADKQKVIEYFPSVLNLLFRIMAKSDTTVRREAFLAMMNIIDTVHSNSYTNNLLDSYVQYLFDNHMLPGTTPSSGGPASSKDHGLASASTAPNSLGELLIENWFYQALLSRAATELVFKYAGFLFQLVYKSMILMLNDNGALKSESIQRKDRFNASFTPLLHKLVTQLAIRTKELCTTNHSSEGRKLYQHVALFLRDLFSIMDRGVVFEMVYRFVFELDSDNDAPPHILECKFQFLRIICNHEQYVSLNFPVADDLSGVPVAEIKTVYWRRHFLAGLLLEELGKCMAKSTADRRATAITTFRDLLWKHDHDPRYFANAQMKERIAQIYFPYILMLIDHWQYFQEYSQSYTYGERRCWLVCFIWILKNVNRTLLQNWWKRDSTPKRKKAFLDILADCLLHFEYIGASEIGSVGTRRNEESALLPSVSASSGGGPSSGSVSSNSLPSMMHAMSSPSLNSDSVTGTNITNTSSNVTPSGTASSSMMMNASNDSIGSTGSGSIGTDDRKRRKHTKVRIHKPNLSVGGGASLGTLPLGFDPKTALASYYTNRGNGSLDIIKREEYGIQSVLTPAALVKKEQNLGKEVAMTIVDVMMDFANDHRNDLVKKENVEVDKFETEKLFEKTFNIFIGLLQCNQASSVIIALLRQFQWIIPKFRTPLFKFRSAVCGTLTYEIVKHMNSKVASVRALACGVLLLMIKHNYEEVKNFSRMKLQSSVAISQLFATLALAHGADGLKDSLAALRYHAMNKFKNEKTKHGTLGTEVKELVARLEHVIEDNLKMEEYSFDPETKADLYHQISRGYADSPDLRTTELEKLAQMHLRDGNLEECAMVRITQAILVGEYLRLLGRMGTEAMPSNSTQVFPNLASEITLPKKQELETLETEICQSRTFTEDGFVMLLAQAVAKLKDQMLFESCVEVYRLLLPIYQFRRNYLRQSDCYEDLHKLCMASVEQMQTNNRIFAQYYRVAFFGGGEKLQELDGQQFIYKENGAVRLDGITERLSEQFSVKIARENIHFVSNVNFERSSMQVGHLYIQLINVEPYFTAEELENKPTLFQQHFNASSFIYETPFFKGTNKDKLSEQWKKKTILTVDGSFPCMKKRLAIKDVKVIDLTPIETATEVIAKKAQDLHAELTKTPVNSKTLQRELQGTLLLQVNAGPAAVATEFLEGPAAASAKPEHKKKLCDTFVTFVKHLAEGVSANNSLISVEQLTLQRELVNGYFRLKTLVCKLTNTPEDAIEQNFSPEIEAPSTPVAPTQSSEDSEEK